METGSYQVVFYTATNEGCPIQEFLDDLGRKPEAKITRFLGYLEAQGPDLPRPYADSLRDKIRELRVPYGRLQLRLLYFFNGKQIVITSGFIKKTDAVPEEEIRRALWRMQDWLNRD